MLVHPDRITHVQAQVGRGASLPDGNLQVAAAAPVGHQLAWCHVGKGIAQPPNPFAAHTDGQLETGCGALIVGDQVAKAVNVEDLGLPGTVRLLFGLDSGKRNQLGWGEWLSHVADFQAAGQVRSSRGKDVPPVKSSADLRQMETRVGQVYGHPGWVLGEG
jgi:hypothetical protein